MSLVKTVIDGREIEVERDRWALDVAREMGIAIPTLCHHPAVEPYGACRLCVVEVRQRRWTWLTTSCDLPIREGLSIRTDTENVVKARRMALELLWAEAPDAAEIQAMARRLGLEKPRFAPRARANKCILCGLCVRICKEVLGEPAIGFSQRGKERVVGSPFGGAAEECIGCGACVSVCPTGHIETVVANGQLKMKTWQTDLALAACEACGEGFAPRRLVERAAKETAASEVNVRLCPRCRAKEAGSKWVDATKLQSVLTASKK